MSLRYFRAKPLFVVPGVKTGMPILYDNPREVGADRIVNSVAAFEKHLGVPVEYTNSIGMKFRLIPPGEFLMGSESEEIAATLKDVFPGDMVILTQPIYLGVHEVTQAEYEKIMGQNSSRFSPTGEGKELVAGMDTGVHPVGSVCWNDAACSIYRPCERN